MDVAARDRARRILQSSRSLHGVYKLAKMARRAPPRAWLDARRTRDVMRVLPNTMLSARSLLNAYECVRMAETERLEGDIAECGVWKGGGSALMALASRRYGGRRTFHLFDSFEGLPQPSARDHDVTGDFRWAFPDIPLDEGDPSMLVPIGAAIGRLDEVRQLLFDVLCLDERSVVIHKGWFQQTVPAAAPSLDKLAVLRLDGDFYESTKVCLEGLFDRVVDNGFVIIDDYRAFEGCRKATDEFLAARRLAPEIIDIDELGVYFRKPPSMSRAR